MDEQIHILERLTSDLVRQLKSLDYEQIEGFVEEREILTNKILSQLTHSKLTETQKHRLKTLLQYDPQILGKMKSLREEARDWMIRQNQIKTQHNAYESKDASESILMDKRK